MGKSCRKCAPNASPRSLCNFGKQPKTAIACKKLFLKKDILNEDYQKLFKKLTLVTKNKRDLELVTSCSSGYETSSKNFRY